MSDRTQELMLIAGGIIAAIPVALFLVALFIVVAGRSIDFFIDKIDGWFR